MWVDKWANANVQLFYLGWEVAFGNFEFSELGARKKT